MYIVPNYSLKKISEVPPPAVVAEASF